MFFGEIFLIGLLAAISPGPDFFIVTRNSIAHGRQIGIASAIGIGAALILHVSYTILGLAFIMMKYVLLFKTIQLIGACYLLYLGILSVKSAAGGKSAQLDYSSNSGHPEKSLRIGFYNGFLCNILNPKAVLFFLSIFSQFLNSSTPIWAEWIYGFEIILTTAGWFIFLSFIISSKEFRSFYEKCHKLLDYFFGGILLYFAYRVLKTVFDES